MLIPKCLGSYSPQNKEGAEIENVQGDVKTYRETVTIVTFLVKPFLSYASEVFDDDSREAICSQVALILCELRKERGLSMTELAAKAGLSRAMISFVEHELRNPTLDTLLRICSVLEVDLAVVLTRASNKVLGSRRKKAK